MTEAQTIPTEAADRRERERLARHICDRLGEFSESERQLLSMTDRDRLGGLSLVVLGKEPGRPPEPVQRAAARQLIAEARVSARRQGADLVRGLGYGTS